MADIVITVAIAGTPEAATADFVCDGSDDQIEINAAIEAAGAAGGGTVMLAAGIYSTSRPIVSFADNVAIEGDSGGGTSIVPAADWLAPPHPSGAEVSGVVSFVAVDNFAARHLTIESGGLLMNGLVAIPDGVNGAGAICTNGIFENNVVRMSQGHTYSIWGQRSEHMQILDNLIEGGSTVGSADPHQEGIEIYGGADVLISGNTIVGIGNAAIQVGGLAAVTPDSSVTGITIVDNIVTQCRVGVFLGTTWGPVFGAADARDILVEGNSFEGLFEAGFIIRNWSGNAADPVELSNVVFRDNTVNLSFAESAGFSPAGLWFLDATGPGETLHGDVLVEGNHFTTTAVAAVPAGFHLGADYSPFFAILNFSDVTITGNDLWIEASAANSRGIFALDSSDLIVSENNISGAGIFPIEFYNVAGFSIAENALSDWDLQYAGIIVGRASEYSITGNALHQLFGAATGLISIYDSGPATSLADNIHHVGQDSTLAGSIIQHLVLEGSALVGTGNALANQITGNAGANFLIGGGGADVMIGLGGNDSYFIDQAGDAIVEAAGGGNDTLFTSVSYVLAANVSVEYLSTASQAGTQAINLTGNNLANILFGNQGANTLNGGAGADTMIGFGGDDSYWIDVATDRIMEAGGGGNDTVFAGFSYALTFDQEVEYMSTTSQAGTAAINFTGNNLSNTIFGNNGANVLNGLTGVDYLVGFGGNDSYFIDHEGDQIYESAGKGNDTLYAAVSYELYAEISVEAMSTASQIATTAINLTGNNLSNTIFGNNGANVLDGGGGNDTLVGFGGADTFAFRTALGGSNVDTILGYSVADDTIALDDAVFAGIGALGALGANAFHTGAAAADASDRIVYSAATGQLFFDADGNGAGSAILFATVGTGLALTASDFIVI